MGASHTRTHSRLFVECTFPPEKAAAGLDKRIQQAGHRLAAILAMMSLRGARHRITALHRLFWRSHGVTIERVYPKQDCHDRDQDWIRKSHCSKANRLEGLPQGWRFTWRLKVPRRNG